MIPLLAAFTMAMVALHLAGEWRRHRPAQWMGKVLASGGFVAVAIAARATETGHGKVLLAALVLSAVGDVALVPRGKAAFFAGLGAFLAAHVAYAAAFLVRGVAPVPLGVALAVLAVPAVVVFRWLRRYLEGPMAVAVLAYMTALTVMVASAVASHARVPSWPLVVGAFAFWLSDLSVASDRLVRPSLATRLWGVPLYYGAQLILAAAAST